MGKLKNLSEQENFFVKISLTLKVYKILDEEMLDHQELYESYE